MGVGAVSGRPATRHLSLYLLNPTILEHCSEIRSWRTKADPLKCDEPDREQFMHITRTVTGATQNF